MTEAQWLEVKWLTATSPLSMLNFLAATGRASQRKVRLFAVACCRSIWGWIEEGPGRRAVEVAELHADGRADDAELEAARHAADPNGRDLHGWRLAAAAAAWLAAMPAASHPTPNLDAATVSGFVGSCEVVLGFELGDAERCCLLRDLVCNPCHPLPSIAPAVLAWNGRLVPRLARSAYEERALPSGHLDAARLAVLADALQDAGCTDAALVSHLRTPGPHLRGCWAVDSLLDKG
jgi:hypothetical protein